MLPGLMCDARVWTAQVATFGHARDVLVADYGDADSIVEMARRALAAAPPHFALAGHSMGARVALEIWRLAPHRVSRLALLDTGFHLPDEREPAARHALLAFGRENGIAALAERWLMPMIAPDNRDADATQSLREMVIDAGLDRFAAQVRALLGRPEIETLLASVTVPVLVGVGSEDRWSPPAQLRAMAAKIPGAQFVEFAGAGHMAPAERPDAVNHALRLWLEA